MQRPSRSSKRTNCSAFANSLELPISRSRPAHDSLTRCWALAGSDCQIYMMNRSHKNALLGCSAKTAGRRVPQAGAQPGCQAAGGASWPFPLGWGGGAPPSRGSPTMHSEALEVPSHVGGGGPALQGRHSSHKAALGVGGGALGGGRLQGGQAGEHGRGCGQGEGSRDSSGQSSREHVRQPAAARTPSTARRASAGSRPSSTAAGPSMAGCRPHPPELLEPSV